MGEQCRTTTSVIDREIGGLRLVSLEDFLPYTFIDHEAVCDCQFAQCTRNELLRRGIEIMPCVTLLRAPVPS